MRKLRYIDYLSLAFLSFATWAVTSWALDKPHRSKRVAASSQVTKAAPTRISVVKHSVEGINEAKFNASEASRAAIGAEAGKAKSRLRISSVFPCDGGVTLEAAAELKNGIRDRHFVWLLTVYPRSVMKVIHVKRYDEQVALSRQGSVELPTFRESIQLLPGEYYVTLAIQEVPPNGVRSVDDPQLSKSMIMAQDVKKFIVP